MNFTKNIFLQKKKKKKYETNKLKIQKNYKLLKILIK